MYFKVWRLECGHLSHVVCNVPVNVTEWVTSMQVHVKIHTHTYGSHSFHRHRQWTQLFISFSFSFDNSAAIKWITFSSMISCLWYYSRFKNHKLYLSLKLLLKHFSFRQRALSSSDESLSCAIIHLTSSVSSKLHHIFI